MAVDDTAASFIKDPDATLDYRFDWSAWLAGGETITTSTFTASAGITIQSSTAAATNTTVWLTGGRQGTPYRITNRIVTSQNRTDDRSLTIRIKDR